MRIERFTIIVDDYDKAIEFFTGALGFDLVEDSPSLTNDGRPKRWVVVRPPGAQTGPKPRKRPRPLSPVPFRNHPLPFRKGLSRTGAGDSRRHPTTTRLRGSGQPD